MEVPFDLTALLSLVFGLTALFAWVSLPTPASAFRTERLELEAQEAPVPPVAPPKPKLFRRKMPRPGPSDEEDSVSFGWRIAF